MKKYFFFLMMISLMMFSCGENNNKKQDNELISKEQAVFINQSQQDFIQQLSAFCGNTFAGQEHFRSLHSGSWYAKKLSILFKTCKPNELKIEFHVDENPPITWILTADNGRLKLMHEHIDSTGELLPGSMYGGVATDQGTSFSQYFPADDYTGKIMEGASENVWIVSLAEDLSWFSYRLDRGKERRFEYRFDLRKPVSSLQ